jgi:DNA-binding transcriptional LysR family regulator
LKIKFIKTFLYLADNNCDFDIHKILNIPRANLWNHINALEKETGLALISRKKQNNSLTEEGRAFVPYARKIYETFESGVEEAKTRDLGDLKTQIVIATTQAIATTWLIPSIKEFHSLYPTLRVSIRASDQLSSKIEIASDIILRPIDELEGFTRCWHVTYHHGLFASRKYLEKKGNPTKPEDLKDHCLIGYGEDKFTGFEEINWHLKGKGYGLPKISPTLTINNTVAIFNAAAEDIGICSTPVESNNIFRGTLVHVLPEIRGPTLNTHFCMQNNTGKLKQRNIYIFRDFFKQYLERIGVKVHNEK